MLFRSCVIRIHVVRQTLSDCKLNIDFDFLPTQRKVLLGSPTGYMNSLEHEQYDDFVTSLG